MLDASPQITYDTVNIELTGPHSHFEEVKLESNPAYETVPNSTSTNDPQYEEIGGGGDQGWRCSNGGEPCLSAIECNMHR